VDNKSDAANDSAFFLTGITNEPINTSNKLFDRCKAILKKSLVSNKKSPWYFIPKGQKETLCTNNILTEVLLYHIIEYRGIL